MPSSNFYPSLSTLIPTDAIPENVGNLQESVQNIFDALFYKDLQIDKSVLEDTGFYRLSLVTYQPIDFQIPGTDQLKVQLFPSVSGHTSIPISLEYRLEILKYINGFSFSNFDGQRDYFDLLLNIALPATPIALSDL